MAASLDERLVCGVDIGGTKTQVRTTSGGRTVVDRTIETKSWRIRDARSDAATLAEIVREASGGHMPAALAVGAHGCDTDAQCLEFQRHLASATGTAVLVVNNSELMVPAAGHYDGVGVVAGTGSIAVARTADGRMLTAGGWGWILGDEGSAPALVREAARAVRGALDRGETGDCLIAGLLREIGTDDPTKLGRLLDATRGAAVWGRYARAVFDAADAGSPLAWRVVREGGEGLAALVDVLVRRGADARRVVAGGGVIAEQPLLMEAFKTAMARVSPASDVLLLTEPPVQGAVALAERLLAAPSLAAQ